MRDALVLCLSAAELVGAAGVFLDSPSDDSTGFYTSLGCAPIGGPASPQPMFLPMTTQRQSRPAMYERSHAPARERPPL